MPRKSQISLVFLLFILILSFSGIPFTLAAAKTIKTNHVRMANVPDWLGESQVQSITDRVQRFLEWDIRRIDVKWYGSQSKFQAEHGFGKAVLAFARRKDSSVHIGPRVTQKNFSGVFAHELAHVVVYQKYKRAIPKWLDEGLANFTANRGDVDYSWLAQQKIQNIQSMTHPFKGIKGEGWKLHYVISTAAMEFIASKCDINDLLQLSVGRTLEAYLSTFCEIRDLNGEFIKWVKQRAQKPS